MRADTYLYNLYALADAKHTTVGAMLGTEKRRFTIKLPPKMAELYGEEAVIIEEEREGISAPEITFQQVFYEIVEEARQKQQRRN